MRFWINSKKNKVQKKSQEEQTGSDAAADNDKITKAIATISHIK